MLVSLEILRYRDIGRLWGIEILRYWSISFSFSLYSVRSSSSPPPSSSFFSSAHAPVYLFCHCLSVLPIGCRFVICVCFCVLVLFCVVARDLFVFVLHFAIVCPRVCVVFDFTDFVFFCFLPFRWAMCFSVLSPFLFDCCCTSCMSLTFLNVTRCFDVKSDFCWLSCIVKQRSFVKCFFV